MQAGIIQSHSKALNLLTHAALSYCPLVGVIMSLITNRHVYYHSIEFFVIYNITNVGGRRVLDTTQAPCPPKCKLLTHTSVQTLTLLLEHIIYSPIHDPRQHSQPRSSYLYPYPRSSSGLVTECVPSSLPRTLSATLLMTPDTICIPRADL